MSENIKHYIVNGYCFESEEDYRKALKEKEGIKYLNSRIVFDDIEKVTRLYEDLIDKEVFTTQIGIEYMRKLRTLIIKKGGSKDIPYAVIKSPGMDLAADNSSKKKSKEPKESRVPFKDKFKTSLIINIVLVIVVAIMFAIALSSSNPNIINYERVLQDKYAGWAQELSSREEALRMQENQNSQN
ncbi:MAG: hypothetical protein PUB17_03935 [Lachnospiraceae bacterium]|nr:hypothetical protein [Lachnospiraceae bacterium]